MKIVLVGQGPFGEKVLRSLVENGEKVVGVFCPPDRRGEPLREAAEQAGVLFFRPSRMKNPEVYEAYLKLEPDLVILAFVTDIIPERLLDLPSIGTICYHPSLLPRHRGASAINWAIIMGETRTGLTILWADKGIDTGPILLQKEVEIGPHDTAGTLYFNTLFPLGVHAIMEAVELIEKGRAPRIPQDDSKATYEPPCDDRVARIDFGRPARDVYNLIRGCDPQPGAYTTFKGKKTRFYEAMLIPESTGRALGEIISIEESGLRVALKDGVIQIGRLRTEKGEKVGPIEFAKLTDLRAGDRFGE
ncbi:MAG: methionyl-tRNA formyltransferase [Syntrophaceae bacterium]|nr:methionyl-tRNA formyltransferase [Syntrophaceae bacterium]